MCGLIKVTARDGAMVTGWVEMRGMARLDPDEEKIRQELNNHWEIVSEGAQTILRAAGKHDAYESLKEQTRGRVLTESEYKAWCDAIDIDDMNREKLRSLSPETYIGLAIKLTDNLLGTVT